MASPAEATEAATVWQPSQLISPSTPNLNSSTKPLSIIILNQPLALRPAIYQAIFSRAKHIIAADGGANRLHHLSQSVFPPSSESLRPTLIIGDLDSLTPFVRDHYAAKGIEIVDDGDQYSTDFGKAHSWLLAQQESEKGVEKQDIVVLGGLGGRVDQGLSVLHHLYMFQTAHLYARGKMYLLSSESITFLLKRGHHKIKVKQDSPFAATLNPSRNDEETEVSWGLGKHVGIIPMREACVITTRGLEWDVEDWKTEFGGMMSTSNWVREQWVDVETSGDVLFTIDIKVEEGDKEVAGS